MKAKASLVKSHNHYEGVSDCLDNLKEEIKKTISNMSSLVIKVNFVDTRYELTTTPFQAVKGFIDFITPFYDSDIVIAEAPSWGVKIDAFEKYSQ